MNNEVELKGLSAKPKLNKRQRRRLKYLQILSNRIPSRNFFQMDSPKVNLNYPHTSTYPVQSYNFDDSKNSNPNWRNDNNLPFGSPGFSLPETVVNTDNVFHCLPTATDSSTANDEVKNEGKEVCPQINLFPNCELEIKVIPQQHVTILSENGNSFQKDVEMLHNAFHSQSRTPGYFLDQVESLYKNHIQELLIEKNKCDVGLEQAQNRRNKNRKLINSRLDTIDRLLRTLGALNMSSNLKMDKVLVEKKRRFQSIRNMLISTACCDIVRSQLKKSERQNRKKLTEELNELRKQLRQTNMDLDVVKKKLEDKINTIQQYSLYEQEKNLEINKLKLDAGNSKIQLTQTQADLEAVCKELNGEMNIFQQILENNANVKKYKAESERDLMELKKYPDNSENFAKSVTLPQQERIMNINEMKGGNVFSEQLALMQCQLYDFCKEFKNRAKSIQLTIHTHTKNKPEELLQLQNQLARTQQELEQVKKALNNQMNTFEQKVRHEQKIMEQLNKAEGNVKVLQNQLAETKVELQAVKKVSIDEVDIFQQKAQHEQKEIELLKAKEEVGLLKSQLTGTQHELTVIGKELSCSSNIVQEKSRHELQIIEELNKAEKEFNKIQEQLIKTQHELGETKVELSNKVIMIQQKTLHEQKAIEERNKLEENVQALQSQLRRTEYELKETRIELSSISNNLQQKAQHELNIMKELKKAKEDIKVLQSRLAEVQHELEKTRIESSNMSNSFQHEQKVTKELNKAEGDIKVLQSLLAEAQQELMGTRKELNTMSNSLQQKVQHEQKITKQLNKVEKYTNVLQTSLAEAQLQLKETRKELSDSFQHKQKIMKEFNDAEEKMKVLQSQLVETQHELETVRKELNHRVNSIQQERKIMEVGFSEIRLMLIKKLGFTYQSSQLFENYMKEGCCQGIVSDIRRLIEDKVKLCDENTLKKVSSKVLQVTENEVHLVVSIASYMKVVPFAASTDFIYSFVAQIDNVISRQHVESLLKKFPTLFAEESVGAGSSNKNWRYLDLKPIITI